MVKSELARDASAPDFNSEAQRSAAITMGDPAGIGPELTLIAYDQRRARKLPPFAIHADPAMLADRATLLGLDVEIGCISDPREAAGVFPERLPVVPVELAAQAVPGRPDPKNAQAVIASIEAATAAVLGGRASAVVTNPIAKSVLYAAGFAHPGHTEFLAHLAGRAAPGAIPRPVMMLASAELRVVPVTIHIPLADVPSALSRGLIVETACITAAALQRYFGIERPRLRLSGLNPHAGEAGTLGDEDEAIIAPAVAELRRAGIDATGPSPADTMFHSAARKTYDVAIAMYHDQALIPIKTLAFDRGVNVTLGLPFVRTSPDHGTAFDIAGSGQASPESLVAAIRMASAMTSTDASRTLDPSTAAAGPHR